MLDGSNADLSVDFFLQRGPRLAHLLASRSCHDLPKTLYRVQHNGFSQSDGSQARFNASTGVLAAKSTAMPDTALDYKRRLEWHLQWRCCKVESCFLSVFGDQKRAAKWASQRYEWTLIELKRQNAKAVVYEVDAAMLEQYNVHVFKLAPLMKMLGISISNGDVSNEFVILNSIPGGAIKQLSVFVNEGNDESDDDDDDDDDDHEHHDHEESASRAQIS